MRASLILCTRNGGERLGNCLRHIEALDAGPEFEFILVDNGSDDGKSHEMAREFARTTRHSCQVIQCLRPGNSAGRNDGVAIASGDILLFIDDDCYPAADFVRAWQAVFATDDVGYGGGQIRKHRPEQSMLGCRVGDEAERINPYELVLPGFLQGSNMAFRRACLDAIGPFDERLGAGLPFCGEDWDVALRASFAGFAGGYFPQAIVSHDHRRLPGPDALSRFAYYEYGNGAMLAKHMWGRKFLPLGLWTLRHLYRMRNRPSHRMKLIAGYRDFRALSQVK